MILAGAAPDTIASWAPGVVYMAIGPLIGVTMALRFGRRAKARRVAAVDTGGATS
jgi:hypothetical protein